MMIWLLQFAHEAIEPEAQRTKVVRYRDEEFVRRQNSIGADEAANLEDQRVKGGEVN
jgi:hypothetical protein